GARAGRAARPRGEADPPHPSRPGAGSRAPRKREGRRPLGRRERGPPRRRRWKARQRKAQRVDEVEEGPAAEVPTLSRLRAWPWKEVRSRRRSDRQAREVPRPRSFSLTVAALTRTTSSLS